MTAPGDTVVIETFDRDVDRLASPIAHPAESLVHPGFAGDIRALIGLTDSVERHRSGEAKIVMPEDDYVGDYKEYILAPFAVPAESRFSDGTFGVLYAGLSRDTAIHESLHWLTRFYADASAVAGSVAPKDHITMRVCAALADVRRISGGIESIYAPNDYTVSRTWGRNLRDSHDGLWYDSVRHRAGECVGVFVPRVVSQVRVNGRIEFTWDGSRFSKVSLVSNLC